MIDEYPRCFIPLGKGPIMIGKYPKRFFQLSDISAVYYEITLEYEVFRVTGCKREKLSYPESYYPLLKNPEYFKEVPLSELALLV